MRTPYLSNRKSSTNIVLTQLITDLSYSVQEHIRIVNERLISLEDQIETLQMKVTELSSDE